MGFCNKWNASQSIQCKLPFSLVSMLEVWARETDKISDRKQWVNGEMEVKTYHFINHIIHISVFSITLLLTSSRIQYRTSAQLKLKLSSSLQSSQDDFYYLSYTIYLLFPWNLFFPSVSSHFPDKLQHRWALLIVYWFLFISVLVQAHTWIPGLRVEELSSDTTLIVVYLCHIWLLEH